MKNVGIINALKQATTSFTSSLSLHSVILTVNTI
jgi:hypothetical protein